MKKLKCIACGGSVNMLEGDKQKDDPMHIFCQMWGHPIKEHDYNNPKYFKTEKLKRYESNIK